MTKITNPEIYGTVQAICQAQQERDPLCGLKQQLLEAMETRQDLVVEILSREVDRMLAAHREELLLLTEFGRALDLLKSNAWHEGHENE